MTIQSYIIAMREEKEKKEEYLNVSQNGNKPRLSVLDFCLQVPFLLFESHSVLVKLLEFHVEVALFYSQPFKVSVMR